MEVGVQPAEETPGEICNANRLQASGLPKCFGKLLWVKNLGLFSRNDGSNHDMGGTRMPQPKAQVGKTDLRSEKLDGEMLTEWLEPINNSGIEKERQ